MSYGLQTFKSDGSILYDSTIYSGIRLAKFYNIGTGASGTTTFSFLLGVNVSCFVAAQFYYNGGTTTFSYSFTYSYSDQFYQYYIFNFNFGSAVYGTAIFLTR